MNAAIEGEEGYALWSDRMITEKVNNATRNLPNTEGPSHFVLTAHEILPNVCPNQKEVSKIRVGERNLKLIFVQILGKFFLFNIFLGG